MKISAIVLGGGKSRRMGQDKTLLTVNGQTLMAATAEALRTVSDDLIIAGNSLCKYGLPHTREVEDSFDGCGPLGGIHSALLAAEHDVAFVAAGDLPRFRPEIVPYLLSFWSEELQMVMPVTRGYGEPLCALYHRSVAQTIAAMIEEGDRATHHLADRVRCCRVPEETLAAAGFPVEFFFNMNTPADYQAATAGGKKHRHE